MNILHKCYVILMIELHWVKFVLTSLKSLLNWQSIISSITHFQNFHAIFCFIFPAMLLSSKFGKYYNNINKAYNSPTTLIVHNSSHCVKLGCLFLLFCNFCRISLQVQLRFSLKFPYGHVELFSVLVESRFVIGQKLRELPYDGPSDKWS